MSRALYVSAFLPDANGSHAGARVAHENLLQLRAAYDVVDAIACTTEQVASEGIDAVHVIRHGPHDLLHYLLLNSASMGLRAVLSAPIVHTRLNAQAHRWLTDRLKAWCYDAVFVDFTQTALLVLRALAASAGHRPPITICLHDVFVQRLLRARGWWSLLFAGPVLREEQALVHAARRILTLSDKDRALVESLYAAAAVELKPFVVPAWCESVERRLERIDPNLILFFGNFDRHENREAVEWFLSEAWDAVVSAVPALSLVLVGTSSDAFARRLDHRGVSGTGFVADPSDWFARCAVAIAPLAHGAGVKFKVLEALSCEVTVVGTPIACEGIDESELLVRATRAEFAARLTGVLCNPPTA